MVKPVYYPAIRDNGAMSWYRMVMTRLGVLAIVALGRLPLAVSRRLTRPLAAPLRLLMGRRRRIVVRNLELCFPQWSAAQRRGVLREHFVQLAEAIAETAFAWCAPTRLDANVGRVEGLEHLVAAQRGGRGVLLLTGHVTCLELSARLIAEQVPGAIGIYRPLRNRLLNDFQTRRRVAYGGRMIERDRLRAMVRELRNGQVLWYAPDQDFGPSRSRFAAFFGIPTATATGMLQLARLGRARVVPVYPLKDPRSGQIVVRFEAAFDKFPGADELADLARFNAFLECRIRQHPAQYWWLHRRFKSAPPDQPPRYP